MNSKDNLNQNLQTNLRACQMKQLWILEEIDRICKKNDICYWLDGGTILGAVRHGGFIPWDDDIDIAMPIEDFKKFNRIAQSELPDNLFLQNKKTDPLAKEPIVKVRDLNSLYVEASDNFNVKYEKGIYVDIFPFVSYPSLPVPFMRKLTKGISKSYSILHKQHYYSTRAVAEWFWFSLKYYSYMLIWKLANLIVRDKKYISNIPLNSGYGICLKKEFVFPLSTIQFEGKTFPAPNNTDAYLKDLYGNYMELPPENKRKIHAKVIIPQLNPNER